MIVLLLILITQAAPVLKCYDDVKLVRVDWAAGRTAYPGDRGVPLTLTFSNCGSTAIGCISVEADLSNTPFTSPSGEDKAYAIVEPSFVSPGGIFTATMFLDVKPDASEGEYTLSISLRYRIIQVNWSASARLNPPVVRAGLETSYGGEKHSDFKVKVTVGVSTGILTFSYYVQPIRPGESSSAIVTIDNAGNLPVYDVRIRFMVTGLSSSTSVFGGRIGGETFESAASMGSGMPIVLLGALSKYYEVLKPKASIQIAARILVSEKCPVGVYPVIVDVRYRLTNGREVSEAYNMLIPVATPFTRPSSIQPGRPYFNIVQVSTSPYPLRPGRECKLIVTLRNEGEKASDVRVSLGAEPSQAEDQMDLSQILPQIQAGVEEEKKAPLTTVGGSTVYLGNVEPGGTVSAMFTLAVGPEAETSIYKLDLYIEFRDHLGNSYREKSRIGVTVERNPELRLYSLAAVEDGVLRGVVANIGPGDAYGVAITVFMEDYGRSASKFIGTIEPYGSKSFEVKLSLEGVGPGNRTLKVVVEYVSKLGNRKTLNRTVQVEIQESAQGESSSIMQSVKPYYLVAACLPILIIYISRRRKEGRKPHYEPPDFMVGEDGVA